jgi:phosphoribosyl-AMP cyclohydrolase / phosphoribosyl-ATP pyrophosphohydrolase
LKITDIEAVRRLDLAKADGLVPVVAQHARTGEVLMLAYANEEALRRTLESGEMWYWSRSRGELWRKGETSGNVQRAVSLHYDCDADAVLALVEPAGPSCHTGEWSCFDARPTLAELDAVLESRVSDGAGGYTAKLLADANLRAKKLGEEAVELALACERGEPARVAEEAADLLYHVLVAARGAGVSLDEVLKVLAHRRSAGRAHHDQAPDEK